MPKAPLTSSFVVTYVIKSEGTVLPGDFDIVSVHVVKQINKVGYAKLVFSDGYLSDQKFRLSESNKFDPGKEIEILMGYDGTDKSVFNGIIINHGIKVVNGNGFLEIECYDKAIQLTAIRNNELFEKQKDSEIISQIIGNYSGLTKKVDATTTKHEQLFQHQATDWDFILSRAEANGLVIVNEDGKLDVVKPDPSPKSALEVVYGTSIFDFDLQVSGYKQIKDVESLSWDVKKQAIEKVTSKKPKEIKQGDFTSKKLAATMGDKTYNLSSPTPLIKTEIQSWADGYATRAALSKLKGSISFIGSNLPKLNTTLSVKGMGKHFDGDGYIAGVEHHLEEGEWTTTCHLGLDNDYAVKNYPDLNALPTGGLLPAVSGLQVGIVTKIDADPENQTRIKINLPTWDDTKDIWARLSSFYASKTFGAFFLPEVGDEVIIGFFNNDPRFPVILGSMYNAKNTPPFEPDDKNTFKGILTQSKMKLEFEEVKKIITIETPGGNTIIIDDDAKSITIEDQNKNKIEMSDSGILLDSPKDIKLTSKANIVLEAKQNVTIKATADFSAEGMNVKQKAKTALALEGLTAELKASTQATIKGAMVMIN